MKSTAALFDMVLSDCPTEKIVQAFKVHLQNSTEMPTPADIFKIIRRDGKPPLDAAYYTALVRKRERTSFVDAGYHGNGLSTEEEKYIAEYEGYMLNG